MKNLQKIVFLTALLVLEAVWKIDASSVTISNNQLHLQGKANIKFLEPQERFWAGLSDARRFPVIHSGDIIALRMAYTYSAYQYRWIRCGYTSSYCDYTTCAGDKVMKANKWSSCRRAQFYIRAVNKNNGQPINSGDYVTLAPYTRGSNCRLRCFNSASSACNSKTCISEKYFKGNYAFQYSYLTFQIFSRKSADGLDPVQYGDTVAFRYPYYTPHYWMYFSGSRLYAKSCSYSSKNSCARKNSHFGFQIFKKL